MQTVWPGTHANLYLIGFIVTCLIVVMNIKVTLRVFAIPAAIAMGATFTGLGLIFVYMFTTGLKDPELLPHYTTFNNTLIGFGVFVFTFEGITLVSCLPFSHFNAYACNRLPTCLFALSLF